jgi:ABC-type transport system involved in cytochrome bd biosynthesis fused ATPase/permease subunit
MRRRLPAWTISSNVIPPATTCRSASTGISCPADSARASPSRALLLDPPVFIMDEPTGSMDNAAESRLRERLSRIIGEKTLLLVTHRNSMLALVDRVIVVDGGKVVADGPKAKVLQALSEGNLRAAANM